MDLVGLGKNPRLSQLSVLGKFAVILGKDKRAATLTLRFIELNVTLMEWEKIFDVNIFLNKLLNAVVKSVPISYL